MGDSEQKHHKKEHLKLSSLESSFFQLGPGTLSPNPAMKSLVALLLLGQIIGSTFSYIVTKEHLNCNSSGAKGKAERAVRYINEHNLHGYKQALNQIDVIRLIPSGGVTVKFYLKLKLLETECHVLDPTPVEKCTVRSQHNHAVESDCDVKVIFHYTTDQEDIFVKCISTPDSVENVQRNCPKCPTLLPLNDPQVVDAVEYVLNKHNEQLSDHVYEVLEISRGQLKFEPEGYYVEFAIVQTNCTAQEAHDDHHHCHPNTTGEDHIAFCRATVFRSHASQEKLKDEKFESDCVILDVKGGHAHSHLVDHHIGKYSTSPGDNSTILNLVHSHNDTSATPHFHETPPVDDCPGKVHHFQL